MSDASTESLALFGTLDEYLISLADGIVAAQTALGTMGAQGAPGQQFSYYLPRLEFELRMDLRVDTTSTSTTGKKALVMKPVTVEEASRTQAEIVSVIKGSFVAVPANDGLPALVLDAAVERVGGAAPSIVAVVRNAAGEPMVGLDVEFNLDRAATHAVAGRAPAARSDVTLAVVRTDTTGTARTTVQVAPGETATPLVFTVDAGPRTVTVSWEVVS